MASEAVMLMDKFLCGLSFLPVLMANKNCRKQRNGIYKLCWLQKNESNERKMLKASIIIIRYTVPSVPDKTYLLMMPHQVLLSLSKSLTCLGLSRSGIGLLEAFIDKDKPSEFCELQLAKNCNDH